VGLTKKSLRGNIEVLSVRGAYVSNPAGRRAMIMDGAEPCNVEEFACRHIRSLGYNALIVENSPIHVLFGVYMSPVIQDSADPRNRIVGVVDRRGSDAGMRGKIIWIPLPDDFGKPEYGVRRAQAIDKHLSAMKPLELQRLFDLRLRPSEDLGQYLWGHRNEPIQVARQMINILPSASIVEMLRYLVEDYWGRRAGWPDLLVYRDNEFFFAEVKSADDKLGKSQERWIRDNRERLHFPFKLVEVLKKLDHDAVAGPGPGSGASGGRGDAVASGAGRHWSPNVVKKGPVDHGQRDRRSG
jgi:VRR-NUC domain